MIRIIIHGCRGRMGRILQDTINKQEDCQIVAGIDRSSDNNKSENTDTYFPIYSNIKECNISADIVIDFSNYKATNDLLEYCVDNNMPVVVATTALGEEQFDFLRQASHKIPVFYSSNMSIGINAIVNSLSCIVPYLDDFNTEIIETHHVNKADSPSGTALLLADSINDASNAKKNYLYGRFGRNTECSINDLCIHSVRGGTVCGEHTIVFAGHDEVIEITHRAYSRDIFALGALKAARFLVNQNSGFYSMRDILD